MINENEDLEPLSEYLTIEFESCDKLPPKPEKEIDYSVIIEKLRAVGGNLRFPPLLAPHTLPLGGNLRFPPYPLPLEETLDLPLEETLDSPLEKTLDSPLEETLDSPLEETLESFLEETLEEGGKGETLGFPLGSPLVVNKSDIKNYKKIKQNYTAKQRHRKIKNFTMRTREEIEKDIENTLANALGKVFGSSQQQEVQE